MNIKEIKNVSYSKKFYNFTRAFTLVELIVVIVILAILATIAFLSFGSQSSQARDWTRLSEMASISKWLWVYEATNWVFPIPDESIKLYSWWTTEAHIIWYQWNAWESIMRIIKGPSEWYKDPLDNKWYTMNTSSKKNKYRITWFLENKWNIVLKDWNLGLIDDVDAIWYDNRYPYSVWDAISVLVMTSWSTITPIQELEKTWALSDSALVLTDNNEVSWFVAYFDNKSEYTTEIWAASIWYVSNEIYLWESTWEQGNWTIDQSAWDNWNWWSFNYYATWTKDFEWITNTQNDFSTDLKSSWYYNIRSIPFAIKWLNWEEYRDIEIQWNWAIYLTEDIDTYNLEFDLFIFNWPVWVSTETKAYYWFWQENWVNYIVITFEKMSEMPESLNRFNYQAIVYENWKIRVNYKEMSILNLDGITIWFRNYSWVRVTENAWPLLQPNFSITYTPVTRSPLNWVCWVKWWISIDHPYYSQEEMCSIWKHTITDWWETWDWEFNWTCSGVFWWSEISCSADNINID